MPKKQDGMWAALSLVGTIGLNMAAMVAVGLFCGKWADKYFNTFPWFTVSGIVFGMAGGLWSTYKKIVK
ncbi:AtpZ/AtpI family protein [Sporomusa sphaeroides]|uniref:F0F1-ATPase subunit (ATPase_gene1) n=1 Tax=Sporomusa sphaeroides DSM 2875 TaxID=1337886 RepID=A0ABM9W5E3_9FIRM|nr:AtpZ/AtpI family protein [Sporomusa sphaeroides]OLS55445.1 putative F0F1-ATPase subunit [Sporomusa sphaeroides DSM 2875]CVK20018.1 Putative F0F1-ATPase subunit (ATPase_gene1) [Sporomusa sphaeroides DSM 2875]